MTNEMKTVLENSYMGDEILLYIAELESDLEEQKSLVRMYQVDVATNHLVIGKLEKALDKACLILENIDNRCAYFEKEYYKAIGKEVSEELEVNTKEEWREVLMKDE